MASILHAQHPHFQERRACTYEKSAKILTSSECRQPIEEKEKKKRDLEDEKEWKKQERERQKMEKLQEREWRSLKNKAAEGESQKDRAKYNR